MKEWSHRRFGIMAKSRKKTTRPPKLPMAGREILLCVTGGIACYKAADLASKLTQVGAGVNVAMTEAATRFVAPLTFQTLTGRGVYTSTWQSTEGFRSQHISLTDLAELVIVAPATANTLGKLAGGIADNLVSTLLLSVGQVDRILAAPAMNTRMWQAPAVRENVEKLKQRGVNFIGPVEGYLACGTEGIGRMAEPEAIFIAAKKLLDD